MLAAVDEVNTAGDLRKLFLRQLMQLFVQGFDFLFQGVQFFFGFHGAFSFLLFFNVAKGEYSSGILEFIVLAIMFIGFMVLRFCGFEVLWFYGFVVLRFCGFVVLWF